MSDNLFIPATLFPDISPRGGIAKRPRMLVGRPTMFEAVSGAPLSKFTFFPLAAEACVGH